MSIHALDQRAPTVMDLKSSHKKIRQSDFSYRNQYKWMISNDNAVHNEQISYLTVQ